MLHDLQKNTTFFPMFNYFIFGLVEIQKEGFILTEVYNIFMTTVFLLDLQFNTVLL